MYIFSSTLSIFEFINFVLTRLFVYYIIYLSIWKCPPRSEIPDECPGLCRPLHFIFDTLDPYVGPVYDQRVQPHLQVLEPYVNKGIDNYQIYVGPRLSALADNVVPPLKRSASRLHHKYLGPYEQRLVQVYDERLGPHVQKASQLADHTYYNYVEPVYLKVSHHAAIAKETFEEKYRPVIVDCSSKALKTSSKYCERAYEWFKVRVGPRLSQLYHNTIEPQLLKISDRVWSSSGKPKFDKFESEIIPADTTEYDQEPKTHSTEEPAIPAEPEVYEAESTNPGETYFVDPELSDGVEFEETIMLESVTSVIAEQTIIVDSATVSPKPSTETSLGRWQVIVKDTTREALNTFLDDVEEEKRSLMEEIRPKFTSILQDLSKAENDAVQYLGKLIDRIEEDEQDEVTPAFVQLEFRARADSIRDKAMAIRKLSQEFAEIVVNRTEEIRRSTVEVLDEFADITLQEIGRKLVSAEDSGESSSSTSSGGAPNWSDWKQYRSLKQRLIQSREEIIEHDINMAEVNQMLREAQETANILAREAAQYLSGLRARADFLFQQRLANRDSTEEDEVPDAEFYEELEDEVESEQDITSETEDDIAGDYDYEEDEEPETITLTRTIYETLHPEGTGEIKQITHYDEEGVAENHATTAVPNVDFSEPLEDERELGSDIGDSVSGHGNNQDEEKIEENEKSERQQESVKVDEHETILPVSEGVSVSGVTP
jgi:hypothetical protein